MLLDHFLTLRVDQDSLRFLQALSSFRFLDLREDRVQVLQVLHHSIQGTFLVLDLILQFDYPSLKDLPFGIDPLGLDSDPRLDLQVGLFLLLVDQKLDLVVADQSLGLKVLKVHPVDIDWFGLGDQKELQWILSSFYIKSEFLIDCISSIVILVQVLLDLLSLTEELQLGRTLDNSSWVTQLIDKDSQSRAIHDPVGIKTLLSIKEFPIDIL